MADAVRRLPGTVLQGNVDPLALQAPREALTAHVRGVCEAARGAPGHIFNVGHGLLPSTPVDGVQALVDAVRAAHR